MRASRSKQEALESISGLGRLMTSLVLAIGLGVFSEQKWLGIVLESTFGRLEECGKPLF